MTNSDFFNKGVPIEIPLSIDIHLSTLLEYYKDKDEVINNIKKYHTDLINYLDSLLSNKSTRFIDIHYSLMNHYNREEKKYVLTYNPLYILSSLLLYVNLDPNNLRNPSKRKDTIDLFLNRCEELRNITSSKKLEKQYPTLYKAFLKEKALYNRFNYLKSKGYNEKDAFKLLLEHDLTSLRASIPYFLRPYIEIKPNGNITEVSLTALEGTENITVQVNGADDYVVDGKKYKSIAIAFEEIDPAKVENAYKLPKNQDGKIYNVWWKKNADTTLIFKDGRFYTKENTVEAQFTTDSYPKFLGQVNDRIKKVDGGWLYKTSWSPNPLKATNYRGFWVKYGEQDFNYLEIGTPSADAYIVVDKNDNKIGTLNEYFAHIVQNLRG